MSFLSGIFGGGGGGSKSNDIEEQRKLQEESHKQQMEMFRLQQQANQDAAEVSAKSSIEKAKHDALMNVANNMK